MSADIVDIIVIGLGVGGEAVAGRLAEAGLDVVGIEAELVGGECPYWGCIPTKMMLRAAGLIAEARRIPGMAGTVEIRPDWAPVAQRIRDEATDNWNDQVAVDRFVGKGGRFVRGRARIIDPRTVEVPGVGVFQARIGLVIGTGTSAAVPPIPGLSGTPFWTNRDAVRTEQVPKSIIVIGGGAIGCEIGQAYARFGSDVTIIEGADRLIPLEDPEAGALLAEAFAEDGIEVRTDMSVTGVTHGDGFSVTLASDETLTAQHLLIATGRRPAMTAEDWEALGLEGGPGFLPVDDRLRVGEGVWAVGDIAGKGSFTHVATYHADIVERDILGRGGPTADHRALPRVTFTDPEIGAVGMTESQARDAGLNIAIGSAQIPSTSRGWIHKAGNSGLIKLIVDADTDLLLGAVSAGPTGGEVLSALTLAVHARVPMTEFESMIYAYPTFHRGIQDAVRDLREVQHD